MSRELFRPRERIRRRLDFLRIYREGKRFHRRGFVLHCLLNGQDYDRLGLAVSRRIGGAVVRNRAKRRLREVFRRNKRKATPGLDLVIAAKAPLATQSYHQIQREFRSAVAEAERKLVSPASRRVWGSGRSVSTS